MLNHTQIRKLVLGCSIPVLLAALAGCAKKPEPVGLKKLAAGAENAGFLSSYANLKPSPRFENTLLFVKQDDAKNVHKYFAVIIDPVEIYVATNADVSKMPDRGRTALAAYFQQRDHASRQRCVPGGAGTGAAGAAPADRPHRSGRGRGDPRRPEGRRGRAGTCHRHRQGRGRDGDGRFRDGRTDRGGGRPAEPRLRRGVSARRLSRATRNSRRPRRRSTVGRRG